MVPSDQHERTQALNTHASFLVQAPAGSGKTALLTQRMLALLAQAEQVPEEIVAITFTKKAASEMQARVFQALQSAKEPEPSEAHAKQTWLLAQAVLARDARMGWQLLKNIHRLRITTIDALCASITRQMPILSTLGAHVQVTEQAGSLYQEAVKMLCLDLEKKVPWQASLACLWQHLDNRFDRLESLLVAMLAKREQWLSAVMVAKADSPHRLRQAMESMLSDHHQHQHQRLCQHFSPSSRPALLRLFCPLLSSLNPEDAISMEAWSQRLFAEGEEAISTWQQVADIILTTAGKRRKRLTQAQGVMPSSARVSDQEKAVSQQQKAAVLAYIADLEDSKIEALQAIKALPPTQFQDASWAVLMALLTVLPVLVAQLRLVFIQHKRVDFNEITLCALHALGEADNPTDIALSLDYHIRHLLVDECQDTSALHYRLLRALTYGWQVDDGRTVFLVGDPMQSIYRFRQADVSLFLRLKTHGLGDVPLTFLALRDNFRSKKPLIDWVNPHFAAVFPSQDCPEEGGVCYHAAVATQGSVHSDEGVAWRLTKDADEEAACVVDCIRTHQRDYPGECLAILVRSRSHLQAILPALRAADIAFSGVALEPLADTLPIRDVLSLTYAMSHLGDQLSWFCVLRAPWCGLDLQDLAVISDHMAGKTVLTTLMQSDCMEALSAQGQIRAGRVSSIMRRVIAERDRQPFATQVKQCWQALGGQASLTASQAHEDCLLYFDLLRRLCDQGPLPPRADVECYLNELYAKGDEHAQGSVVVMTIHKSKGLEFDQVIVPGMARPPRAETQPLLVWQEQLDEYGGSSVFMAPIKSQATAEDLIYRYLFNNDKQRVHHEIKRLLYVAITRAKKRVTLLATVTEKDDGVLQRPAKESFLGHLWPVVSDALTAEYTVLVGQAALAQQVMPIDRPKANTLHRLATLPALTFPALNLNAAGLNQPTANTHTARLHQTIGTLVHWYLALMAQQGLRHWDTSAVLALDETLQLACQRYYVAKQDQHTVVMRVQEALINVLDDDTGRWLLDAHDDAHSEWVLYTMEKSKPKAYCLDRSFIDEQGGRWIIDYKTARPDPKESMEDFLRQQKDAYLPQMQRYARLVQDLDPETRPMTLALYFPFVNIMVHWPWQAPATAQLASAVTSST